LVPAHVFLIFTHPSPSAFFLRGPSPSAGTSCCRGGPAPFQYWADCLQSYWAERKLIRDGPSSSLTTAAGVRLNPPHLLFSSRAALSLSLLCLQSLPLPLLSRGLAAPTGRAALPFDASSQTSSPPTTTHQVRPLHILPSYCAKLSVPKLFAFGSDPIPSIPRLTCELRFFGQKLFARV
jgi:hypothetical protein